MPHVPSDDLGDDASAARNAEPNEPASRDGEENETRRRARALLAEEYERGGPDGPYPTYAELARNGNGAFTLCSIRAIERAVNRQDELFAALKPMFDRWEPDTAGADRRMWENARAALFKTEGE